METEAECVNSCSAIYTFQKRRRKQLIGAKGYYFKPFGFKRVTDLVPTGLTSLIVLITPSWNSLVEPYFSWHPAGDP